MSASTRAKLAALFLAASVLSVGMAASLMWIVGAAVELVGAPPWCYPTVLVAAILVCVWDLAGRSGGGR